MEKSCKEMIVVCDPTLWLLVLRIFWGKKRAESQDSATPGTSGIPSNKSPNNQFI